MTFCYGHELKPKQGFANDNHSISYGVKEQTVPAMKNMARKLEKSTKKKAKDDGLVISMQHFRQHSYTVHVLTKSGKEILSAFKLSLLILIILSLLLQYSLFQTRVLSLFGYTRRKVFAKGLIGRSGDC